MQAEEAPDIGWVARLSGRPVAAATRAVAEAAAAHRLFEHLAREHRAEGRASYIEIDAPLEVYALARLGRPRHVVEVGVSSGVSSAYLLAALERNGLGTLHSVDLPSRPRRAPVRPGGASWSLPPGRSSGWAVPLALRRRWDLRLGDKADVLPLLARELPRIDLFVYDVPHNDAATLRELEMVDRRMRAGSVAIVDHGPGGELCSALRRWSRSHGSEPVGRAGLGLYGARRGPRAGRGRPGA